MAGWGGNDAALGTEIPQWALEKAHGLLKVECGLTPHFERYTRSSEPVTAFARYIAQHEQPPVDPDVIAVREIVAAAFRNKGTSIAGDLKPDSPAEIAAVIAYRKHKEAGK